MIIIRFFATLRMTIRYKMTASADIPWFRNEQDKAREENPEELSYRRLKALLRRK